MTENKIPLVEVYGENAIELALQEIITLRKNSNFVFDTDYINLGISFMTIKATQILKNEKKRCSLATLASESFGEAAIYKFNR